jgi:hypothetical protein
MPGLASESSLFHVVLQGSGAFLCRTLLPLAIFTDDNSFERLSYACEENSRGQKNKQLA